jgi:hypothetical protein
VVALRVQEQRGPQKPPDDGAAHPDRDELVLEKV